MVEEEEEEEDEEERREGAANRTLDFDTPFIFAVGMLNLVEARLG